MYLLVVAYEKYYREPQKHVFIWCSVMKTSWFKQPMILFLTDVYTLKHDKG